MDRRTKNVEIFKDSVKLMNGSSRLQQAITESQNKQKLYLETEDVAVLIKANHTCMSLRGAEDPNASTVTLFCKGKFLDDPKLRSEFLQASKQ